MALGRNVTVSPVSMVRRLHRIFGGILIGLDGIKIFLKVLFRGVWRMFLLFIVIFSTLAVLAGYFVLAVAGKTEGGLQKFGKVLAIWLFVLAALPVLAGGYMAVSGHGPGMMRGHMGGWTHGQHGEKGCPYHEKKYPSN